MMSSNQERPAMQDKEMLELFSASARRYEGVGDRLFAAGRYAEARRAYDHSLGDICRMPTQGYNMLPDYKRVYQKSLDCLLRMSDEECVK